MLNLFYFRDIVMIPSLASRISSVHSAVRSYPVREILRPISGDITRLNLLQTLVILQVTI